MQIEGMIRAVCSRRRVGAVLGCGAHVVGPFEARVDCRLPPCAGVPGAFGEALAGVVVLVGEIGGGDGGAWCGGGGVGAGRVTYGCGAG